MMRNICEMYNCFYALMGKATCNVLFRTVARGNASGKSFLSEKCICLKLFTNSFGMFHSF